MDLVNLLLSTSPYQDPLSLPSYMPSLSANNAKFKERFLKRFATKDRGRVSPNSETDEARLTPSPTPSDISTGNDVAARIPSSPILSSPPNVATEEKKLDVSLTQQDGNPYQAPPSQDHYRSIPSSPFMAPSTSNGSFFNNSKRFVINNATFINNSAPKTRLPTDSVAFDMYRRRIPLSAMHDSSERFDPPKCDEDTRTGILEELTSWIGDPNSPSHIAVITGPAGSGKSAIQQTLAEICAQQNTLAGSFFFSISDPARSKHHHLFTTLIYQIAQTNKDLRPFIEQAIKDDAAILDRSLEKQIHTLLIDPLQAANAFYTEHSTTQWPWVLIIDGIDECRGEEMQSHVLEAIHKSFVVRKLPYKIILASRPEFAIRTALETYLKTAYHIKLHEHDASADIKLYLRRRLRTLGEASSDPRASDPLWPTERIVDKLTDNSSGQFVYVATVIKFASNRRASPFVRIEQVLAWEPGVEQRKNPFATLDALYTNILSTAEEAYREDSEDDRSVIELLRELMIYKAASPFIEMDLSLYEFERLLHLRQGQIEDMLSDLHSLIKKTTSDTEGWPRLNIQFHHKSFLDFLGDPGRSSVVHRSDSLLYTHLLKCSVTWLGLSNYNLIQAACVGLEPADSMSAEMIEIVRFSLCYWPAYLFKSLIMDVDQSQPNHLLLQTMTDLFLSRGWIGMKRYIREYGLFHCLPQPFPFIQQDALEEIWTFYISQSIELDVLSSAQNKELEELLGCLRRSRHVTGPRKAISQTRVNYPIMTPSATWRHTLNSEAEIMVNHAPLNTRHIRLSYPPMLSKRLWPKAKPPSGATDDDRWSGSTPLDPDADYDVEPGEESSEKEPIGLWTRYRALPSVLAPPDERVSTIRAHPI